MTTPNTISLFKIPGPTGIRVLAQALSDAPLRFVDSENGEFAVVWRTYNNGRPHSHDGQLWLLESQTNGGYKIIHERKVFYANTVAVANNGCIAWVRADSHRGPVYELNLIDIDGETIIEEERMPSAVDRLAFSNTGATIAAVCARREPKDQRIFAWDTKSGKRVAAFSLLLTVGSPDIEVQEEMVRITTYYGTHADYNFDGDVIFDNRFDGDTVFNNPNGHHGSNLWLVNAQVGKLPIEQLNYALDKINGLIQTRSFESAPRTEQEYVISLRRKVLGVLGETPDGEEILTLNIKDADVISRLRECVLKGHYGNNPDEVAANLLTRALDFLA